MAVKDFFDNLNGGARWDVGVSINRSNSLPLDANSVFASLEAAQNYAAGNPAEGTLANAYPGQVLAVVTDAETVIYYIDANMALQPVGNTKDVMAYIGNLPEGTDAKTIVEYINAKTEGIATTESLAQLQKDVTALGTTVGRAAEGDNEATGLVGDVAAHGKTLADITGAMDNYGDIVAHNADEFYTKEEADAEFQTASEVYSQITGAIQGLELGDMSKETAADYVKKSEAAGYDDILTKTEASGAYQAKGDYYTKTETDSAISAKIAEINHAVFQKVDAVPAVADAVANVMYLVPNGDKLDIYAKIGEEMVLIDDTDTDLSGYALKSELHEHANKALLDTYDQTNADIKDAVAKKHEHSFTDDNVVATIAKAHEHTNLTLLETYTQTEEDLADAVAKKHEHANVDVLDGIDADKVAAWDEAEKNVIASVDPAQFAIDADRNLTLLGIAQEKVTGLKNAAGNEISLADALANKVDQVEGSRLINADEIAKLAGLVVDPETGETSLPVSGQIAMSQVDGLAGALEGKVDKVDGMGLSANNFTNELLEKLNGISASAQVNVIEGIKFNGALVNVGEDKIADITYTLPIADADTLGGVLSSDAENKVSVAADGTMEVNTINVNKLTQTDGEYLIMNGGGAKL